MNAGQFLEAMVAHEGLREMIVAINKPGNDDVGPAANGSSTRYTLT